MRFRSNFVLLETGSQAHSATDGSAPQKKGLLRIHNVSRWPQAVRINVHTFFSLIESQAINRPAARLIHDPVDDRPVSRIVGRGLSPYVIENIEGEFFGRFPIRGYPHDQRKNDSMRLLVNGMQCALVTGLVHRTLLRLKWAR